MFLLIFRALDYATAKTVDSVVKYGVLPLRNSALFLVKLDVQTAVLLDADVHGLVGLTIAELRHTVKFRGLRFGRNPVETAHFAGFGVERAFVAVGDVKDVIL